MVSKILMNTKSDVIDYLVSFLGGLEMMDFDSPFNTLSVLSSTTKPLPEAVQLIFFFLVASLDFLLPLVLRRGPLRRQAINRSCEEMRCFCRRVSTLSTVSLDSFDSFFLAKWSSICLRSFIFSSLRVWRDCSKSEVKHFLRKRLFLACFRFRSL